MPHFLLQINPSGALINLSIGVSVSRASALKNASQPIPNSILVQGLIDTGASGVCIDPTLTQLLSLQPTGTSEMLTPSTGNTPQITPVYDISIKIPHAGTSLDFDSVPAMESVLLNQGFHVLIGRDILSKCLLIYDGVTNLCTLAF